MRAALASAVGVLIATGCAPLSADTARTRAELERQLPVGRSLADVEATVKARQLSYTVYSPRDCENNAKITSPTYTVKGGPCLFALAKVGATWYGYTVDLQLRLFFDPSGKLVDRDFQRIDTFI